MSEELIYGHQIREKNLRILSQALHREQVATVAQLSAVTGISVVTANKLLRSLLEQGVAIDNDYTVTSGGRPARSYRFNANFKQVLLITCYQRGTSLYAGYSVHDMFGECLERREELLPRIHTDELTIGIEHFLERFPRLAMIGISMPSDNIGGRAAAAVRRDPMAQRLARHMESRFKVPVTFETDINAAALGCYQRHQRERFVAALVLAPGRAPACGFCYDGTVIRGRDGMAGEVRYFPMYNDLGVLPRQQPAAEDLAIRTIRAVMCVMNPSRLAIYTESLDASVETRLRRQLGGGAEAVLLPTIELSAQIRDDIVSGMVSICLARITGGLAGPEN
ncbi:MAG: ROK family protein [Succinivibrionaceae bacterium]|nr:ROK family protein [Succinivibrionaceae bacterium]